MKDPNTISIDFTSEFIHTNELCSPLFSTLPIIIFDAKAQIIRINEAGLTILKISGDQAPASLHRARIRPITERFKRMPSQEQPWKRCIKSRRRITNTVVGLAYPDDDTRWFQTTSIPIALPTKSKRKQRYALTVFTDITDQKKTFDAANLFLKMGTAVRDCAEQIFCAGGFCSACSVMKDVLNEVQRQIPSIHQISIFENSEDPMLGLSAELTSAVTRSHIVTKSEKHIQFIWTDEWRSWQRKFEKGKHITGASNTFPTHVQDILSKLGASSAAIFPMISGKEWLGFLLFSNMNAVHKWSNTELALLKLTTDLVATLLGRRKIQQRILQSQKLEAIGSMAGGLAHDFNNILTGISTTIQLMQMDYNQRSEIYDDLQLIQDELHRATDLSKQLLLYSQPTEGHARTTNLNTQINLIAKLLKRTLPKSIQLDLHLCNDKLWARIDPTQIEQVLLNLVFNARDAMPDGGSIIIQSQLVDWQTENEMPTKDVLPGIYAEFSVQDHGSGISARSLKKVFEPFYTTKKSGSGSGLGLSMVRTIMRKHGGFIHVSSRPGKGSTFYCYLPYFPVASLATEETNTTPSLPGGTESILVVDDEPTVIQNTSMLLSRFGYTIHSASNGNEAIDLIINKHHPIDLVIMDVAMPEMDGETCLNHLLAINRKLKVIMMSGYAVDALDWDPEKAGARAFLEKPYSAELILNVIRQVLDED